MERNISPYILLLQILRATMTICCWNRIAERWEQGDTIPGVLTVLVTYRADEVITLV